MASRKRYAALSAATRARSQIVAKGVGSLLTWDWTLLPLAVTTSRESAMILSSSDCISLSLIYRLMIPTAPFMRMGIWGCCWPTGKEHTGASSPQFVFLVESKVTKLTFLIFFFLLKEESYLNGYVILAEAWIVPVKKRASVYVCTIFFVYILRFW